MKSEKLQKIFSKSYPSIYLILGAGIFIVIFFMIYFWSELAFWNQLNQNSGAVIAIFTAVYVVGTLLMWLEIRRSRIRLDKPNIQISLQPQERWGNFFDLVVENLGNVPVYDLRLQIKPKGLKTMGDKKLEDLNLFTKTIPIFGIGQRLRTLAIDYVDFIHSDQPKKISFVAEYKDKNNGCHAQRYDFDMEIYLNMSASSEKTLKDIVGSIEKLTKEISKISKYYNVKKVIENFNLKDKK